MLGCGLLMCYLLLVLTRIELSLVLLLLLLLLLLPLHVLPVHRRRIKAGSHKILLSHGVGYPRLVRPGLHPGSEVPPGKGGEAG